VSNLGDHYFILGVSHYATVTDIKRAFRRLVLIHHPDKNGSSTPEEQQRHTRITEKLIAANETLSDPILRRKYDDTLVGPDVVAEPFESAGVQLAGDKRKTNGQNGRQPRGPMRRLVEHWLGLNQNVYWRFHPFLHNLRGKAARERLAEFVRNNLSQEELDKPRFQKRLTRSVFNAREKS
jgi:curved DNA-binding protein CbpA